MTPYELGIYVDAYNEKRKAESEEKLILTYLGAYWQRVKRMPMLKKLIEGEKQKTQMTPEEMLEKVKKLNAALGGTTY